MHTRSKRYIRRHRARLRAQRRSPLKPFLECENRLAQQISFGMKKRWAELVLTPEKATSPTFAAL